LARNLRHWRVFDYLCHFGSQQCRNVAPNQYNEANLAIELPKLQAAAMNVAPNRVREEKSNQVI
jgi:hypothetical protein